MSIGKTETLFYNERKRGEQADRVGKLLFENYVTNCTGSLRNEKSLSWSRNSVHLSEPDVL